MSLRTSAIVVSSSGNSFLSTGPKRGLFFGSKPGIQSVILTRAGCFPVIIDALVGEHTELAA